MSIEQKSDNTRVQQRPYIPPRQMSDDEYRDYTVRQYRDQSDTITDADVVEYYRNKQNFYNTNAFGYGLQGNQTNYDPTTPEGQAAIDSNFDYAKESAMTMLSGVGEAGLSSSIINRALRSPFKRVGKSGYLGKVSDLKARRLGSGSESEVVNNNFFTVGKVTTIPKEEMVLRNAVPEAVPSQYIGYMRDGAGKRPTYIQQRMRIVKEDKFPKYLEKLDKAMQKHGFKPASEATDGSRIYTNGEYVIDDIKAENIGIDWRGNPKLIDFARLPVDEWLDLGYSFKRGGKLIKRKYNIH